MFAEEHTPTTNCSVISSSAVLPELMCTAKHVSVACPLYCSYCTALTCNERREAVFPLDSLQGCEGGLTPLLTGRGELSAAVLRGTEKCYSTVVSAEEVLQIKKPELSWI